MSKLYLMMGIPGSGKSYFCKNNKELSKYKYISRDEVRFSFLQDGDDYFSKENQVFAEFVKQINGSLAIYDNVIADATHLNPSSRNKLIRNIRQKIDEINVIYMNTPLDVAIERNSHRTGRKFVPVSSIKSMYNSIELPSKEEGISKVYTVTQDKPIEIKELL